MTFWAILLTDHTT